MCIPMMMPSMPEMPMPAPAPEPLAPPPKPTTGTATSIEPAQAESATTKLQRKPASNPFAVAKEPPQAPITGVNTGAIQ